jgi:hypothetical protein
MNLQPDRLPPPHPLPPTGFESKILPTTTTIGPFYRLSSVRHPSALHFDQSGRGRFEGASQPYGILYTGADEYAAFIETFGRRHGQVAVEESVLRGRSLFRIVSNRPLNFVDLTGSALVKIGADARLTTGSYAIARAWAQAIFDHPQKVDGLKYFSRHDNTRVCFGIFDRSRGALSEQDTGNLLDDQSKLLAEILEHYDYGLF